MKTLYIAFHNIPRRANVEIKSLREAKLYPKINTFVRNNEKDLNFTTTENATCLSSN